MRKRTAEQVLGGMVKRQDLLWTEKRVVVESHEQVTFGWLWHIYEKGMIDFFKIIEKVDPIICFISVTYWTYNNNPIVFVLFGIVSIDYSC